MDKDLMKSKKDLFSRLRRNLRCESVIQAMERVPRELFVPPESRHLAYMDVPLAIGESQTTSQPYMVALMAGALGLNGNEKVLEVGTGSGYEAAVLSLLVPRSRVVTVELIPTLAEQARKSLLELGCRNVDVELAGPTLGSPARAPFDAIVVAAAAPRLPDSLISHLAVGGRLVIPVGPMEQQELVQVLRTDEGPSLRLLGACRFVPLIGREAFPRVQ